MAMFVPYTIGWDVVSLAINSAIIIYDIKLHISFITLFE